VSDSVVKSGYEMTEVYRDEEPSVMSKAVGRIITAAEDALDLGELRRRLEMSQEAFAASFVLPKRTIQDWEQGRRYPEGRPACCSR